MFLHSNLQKYQSGDTHTHWLALAILNIKQVKSLEIKIFPWRNGCGWGEKRQGPLLLTWVEFNPSMNK